MNTLTIRTALIARTYLYRITQMLLGEEPTRELLDVLFSDTTKEALSCFERAEHEPLAQVMATFSGCKSTYESDRTSFLKVAQRDYMHALVGPEDLKAPPWECVYLTGERILFQEATLKVREAYRSENMLPTQYPHVSDDHIAIELDFMGKLSVKCQEAFEVQDATEFRRLLGVQSAFLREHLLKWVTKYTNDLGATVPNSLYAYVGTLCAAFLHSDAELLEELECQGIPQKGAMG